jgi:hypothetical protein
MKKIFLSLILSFSFFTFAFASEKVELFSNTPEVESGENFTLSFSLESTGSQLDIKKIDIDGVEKFVRRGDSQSQQIVMVNGNMKTKLNYDMSFDAIQPWEYIVWPVRLETASGTLVSNTISIKVWKAKQWWTALSQAKKWENIYDVKDPETWYDIFKILSFIALFALFFIGFFFVLKYFFSSEKQKKIQEKDEIPQEKNIIWKNKIKKLREELSSASREDFYSELSFITREYFEQIFFLSWATKMTLKEIEKKVNTPQQKRLFALLKDIYYTLFDEKTEDNREKREAMLDQFLEIISL